MLHREISKEQAEQVAWILHQECGLGLRNAEQMIYSITTDEPEHICHEYRFMGALGFGGKFRNNGNKDNTPYVDFYPEDENPERVKMIENANKRLAELFSTAKAGDAFTCECCYPLHNEVEDSCGCVFKDLNVPCKDKDCKICSSLHKDKA